MAEEREPQDAGGEAVAFTCLGHEVRLHLPDREDHIQRLIAAERGFYEMDMLRDIAGRGLPEGGLAIDVGANIGNHTVFLAGVLGLEVIALEPLAACRAVLARNLELNGLTGRVRLLAQAAGAAPGRGRMVVEDPRNLGRSRFEPDPGGEVEVVRLDDLELPGRVALLKVDVERMELEVLRGAAALLARDQPLVYVEAPEPDAQVGLRRLLGPLGYVRVEQFNFTPTLLFLPARAEDQRFAALMARLEGLEHAVTGQQAALERLLQREAARTQDQGSKQQKALVGELHGALKQLPLAELQKGQATLREGQAALSRDQVRQVAAVEKLTVELRAIAARTEAGLTGLQDALAARARAADGRLAELQDGLAAGRRQAEAAALAQGRGLAQLEGRLRADLQGLEARLLQRLEQLLSRLVQLDDLVLEGVRLVQLDHRLLEAWLGLPGRVGRPVRALIDQLGEEVRGPLAKEVRALRKKVALRTRLRRLAKRLRKGEPG